MSAPGFEVVLVRHGQAEDSGGDRLIGQSTVGLTALGREQAARAAAHLAALGAAAVVSSDQLRAIETATPIAHALGVPLRTAVGLRERGLGAWTGLAIAEAESADPALFRALRRADPDARPPGGESLRECLARALAELDRLRAELGDARVVVVSHAATIAGVLEHIDQHSALPGGGAARSGGAGPIEPSVPIPRRRRIGHAAVQRIARAHDGSWAVLETDGRAHLAGLAPSSG